MTTDTTEQVTQDNRTPAEKFYENSAKTVMDKFLNNNGIKINKLKKKSSNDSAKKGSNANSSINKNSETKKKATEKNKQVENRKSKKDSVGRKERDDVFDVSSSEDEDDICTIIDPPVYNEPFNDIEEETVPTPAKKAKTTKGGQRISMTTPTATKNRNPYKSKNRRECKRKVSTNKSTPEKSNRQHFSGHKEKTRFTVMFNKQSSMDPEGRVTENMKGLSQELFRVDKTSAMLPWCNADFGVGKISKKTAFPTNFNHLKFYSDRLYAGKPMEERNVWAKIYIGHDISSEEILDHLRPWAIAGGHRFYRNMLQAEESTEIGWLGYSTREMDAGALADEILEIGKIHCGLRWKPIDNGEKNLAGNQKVYALHIEVDARSQTDDKKKLLKLYGRSSKPSKEYPNGIRLRFVPLRSKVINTKERIKIENLRLRQRLFLQTVRTQTTFDIMELDRPAGKNQPSLREMMMSLSPSNGPGTPLFHCIDLDYRRQGYVLQYSEDNAVEAECVINAIIPYVKHFFPILETGYTISEWFDPIAIDRSEHLYFCEENNMVMDKQGENNMIVELLDDDGLTGFDFSKKLKENEDDLDFIARPNVARTTLKRVKPSGPYDDDSQATFKTSGDKTNHKPSSGKRGEVGAVSVSSNISGLSDGSYKTFKSTMSASVHALQTQIDGQNKTIDNRFGELKEMLNMIQLHIGLNGPATGKDDVPNPVDTTAGGVNTSGQTS